jgi:drug/metabolite transporter (DMT)-like permease
MDRRTLLLIVILTGIWGTGPVVARFLVGVSGEIMPTDLALVRWIIAFVFLFVVLSRNQSLNETKLTLKADWLRFLLIGVTIAGFGLLFLFGVSLSFAVNAALLTNLHPIFIAVLAHIFLNEKTGVRQLLGVFTAITGMLIVVTGGNLSTIVFGSEQFIGDILLILSALAWSIQSLLARKYVKKYGGLQTITLSAPFTILVLIPFALFLGNMQTLLNVSLIGWLLILHFSLGISGIGYVLWFVILRRIETAKASVSILIVPIYTIIFANIFLNEPITLMVVVGTVFVLTGIYLVQRVNS